MNSITLKEGRLHAIDMPEYDLSQDLTDFDEAVKKAKAKAIDFRPEDYHYSLPDEIEPQVLRIYGNGLNVFNFGGVKEGEIYPCPEGFRIEQFGVCESCNNVGMRNCAHADKCDGAKIYAKTP